MTGYLFAPKVEKLISVIAEGIRENEESLQFFGSYEGHVFEAMDYIIDKYHEINSGRITTSMMFKAIEKVAKIYEMAKLFERLEVRQDGSFKNITCTSEEKTLFAVGVLDEDYKDGDPDPYETAGGYRSWIAKAGTPVFYYMNADLSVRAVFDSNCVIDHYNNNFFGVSTGNGTTNYQIGERIEKRSVRLERVFIDPTWTKTDFKATVKKIDIKKAQNLCAEFVPEFSNVTVS